MKMKNEDEKMKIFSAWQKYLISFFLFIFSVEKIQMVLNANQEYTPVSVTRWVLKAHPGDFEMENTHRGRLCLGFPKFSAFAQGGDFHCS